MLLKLDTSGAIDFSWSFWTLFNLFLMDSAEKILLKYVNNIISRVNSRSSIQLDPKFGKNILFKFLIGDTLDSYSMVKKWISIYQPF